jgi:hypothetical protein
MTLSRVDASQNPKRDAKDQLTLASAILAFSSGEGRRPFGVNLSSLPELLVASLGQVPRNRMSGQIFLRHPG